MKKVEVTEISAYTWECPECNEFNMHDTYSDVICEHCGEEFEIEKIN